MLNQRKQSGDASKPEMALCQPQSSNIVFFNPMLTASALSDLLLLWSFFLNVDLVLKRQAEMNDVTAVNKFHLKAMREDLMCSYGDIVQSGFSMSHLCKI